MTKTPAHVAVEVQGLRIFFEQAAGPVNASALTYPLELGHSTAVVAALDTDKTIKVNDGGGVTVETAAPTAAPTTPGNPPAAPPATAKNPRGTSSTPNSAARDNEKGALPTPSKPDAAQPAPTPVTGGEPAVPSAEIGAQAPTGDTGAQMTNPDEGALPNLGDVERKLGLRGARSVSNAFGAFLGLGLILPVARFLIRRLG